MFSFHDSAVSSCPGSGQQSRSLQVTQAMSCGTLYISGEECHGGVWGLNIDRLRKADRKPSGVLRISSDGDDGRILLHRPPKLCGSSLDFKFIRECMKINKIRPKFNFWQKWKYLWLTLCFCFIFTVGFASRAIWKPFYRRLILKA